LHSGVAAAVGDIRTDSADIQHLIPNFRKAGFTYFRKTGIYPINHTVVVKDSLLKDDPGFARNLFGCFQAAKKIYLGHLDGGKKLSPADKAAIAIKRVVGDPFPFGVNSNRKALEAIIRFAVDQQIIPQRLSPEDLFAESTLSLQ
jgi:4,5-dihydroxyphthalate decarboxylase